MRDEAELAGVQTADCGRATVNPWWRSVTSGASASTALRTTAHTSIRRTPGAAAGPAARRSQQILDEPRHVAKLPLDAGLLRARHRCRARSKISVH
jgi:hypothetical protein